MIKVRLASEFKSGEPGLYQSVPDAEYHAFDACSNSRLSKLRKSPAHCRSSFMEAWKETPALKFGRAAHAAILTPMEFATDYVVFKGEKRTKAAKEEYAALSAKFEIVSEADAERIANMQKALRNHAVAKAILDLGGYSELSALWVHEPTGLLCKLRIDFFAPDKGIIVDYKTTIDAEPREFERSLYRYGYHRQGASYLLGMSALGLELKDFILIPQEKERPYALSCLRIKNDALEAGRSELEPLFAKYAECKESGIWPSYGEDKIVDMDIPDWSYRLIYDNELEEVGK